jgi:hypothetical protein
MRTRFNGAALPEGSSPCSFGTRSVARSAIRFDRWRVALQRPSVESDQQVLIKLEQGWNQAFYRKDLPFISSLLADEFVATYDDGSRGDKAKELALAGRVRSTSGVSHSGRVHGAGSIATRPWSGLRCTWWAPGRGSRRT